MGVAELRVSSGFSFSSFRNQVSGLAFTEEVWAWEQDFCEKRIGSLVGTVREGPAGVRNTVWSWNCWEVSLLRICFLLHRIGK